MAVVSDDRSGTEPGAISDVASLAAQYVKRRRADFARAGAAADLANLAALEAVLAEADALLADPGPVPEPDGSDIARRLERISKKAELTGRLGGIMARVCTDSPDQAGLWHLIADMARDGAAQARQAAEITAPGQSAT